MPDKFDPYREALVIETTTIWPSPLDQMDPSAKQRISQALHADPAHASHLAYVRQHTGFLREITVTSDDVSRFEG